MRLELQTVAGSPCPPLDLDLDNQTFTALLDVLKAANEDYRVRFERQGGKVETAHTDAVSLRMIEARMSWPPPAKPPSRFRTIREARPPSPPDPGDSGKGGHARE